MENFQLEADIQTDDKSDEVVVVAEGGGGWGEERGDGERGLSSPVLSWACAFGLLARGGCEGDESLKHRKDFLVSSISMTLHNISCFSPTDR